MENDKENINRSPPKSRIPVLVRPPSTKPKRIFEIRANRNLIRSDSKTQREPLKTIDHHNIYAAGPSCAKASKLNQFQWHIDTKYVTFRQKDRVVPPVDQTINIMTKSDERVSEVNVIECNIAKDIHSDRLCEVETVATPNILGPVGENLRVKNIKKSLKRPHSRELQGISHQGKQNKNHYENIQMRYKEMLKDRLESPDFINRSYMTCLAENYVSDLFKYLLEVERKPLDSPNLKNVTRSCLINWLVKVNGINGQPDTVQTACWYLDSILGTRLVEVHNLQVVAAACYWIAQKLHGPFMIASNLVKCSDRAFTCSKLLAAERAVLVRLNFPPQPVIPQDFINYLAWWCDNEHPGDIELAATFLCMSGLMVDKSLCLDYPSVIAAASVRNALLLYKGKHLMKQLTTCPLYQSAESKAAYFGRTCSILRRAVRTVASQDYEYKATYEQFGFPPSNIAQKVINAAIKLYESDKKNF